MAWESVESRGFDVATWPGYWLGNPNMALDRFRQNFLGGGICGAAIDQVSPLWVVMLEWVA